MESEGFFGSARQVNKLNYRHFLGLLLPDYQANQFVPESTCSQKNGYLDIDLEVVNAGKSQKALKSQFLIPRDQKVSKTSKLNPQDINLSKTERLTRLCDYLKKLWGLKHHLRIAISFRFTDTFE